jgi:hypothetical protein
VTDFDDASQEPTAPEQEGVRIEAILPRRTYEELAEWGEEIGCGAGFVLWAVVADAVHKRPEDIRPRVAAAWEEAQKHGMEAADMEPDEG